MLNDSNAGSESAGRSTSSHHRELIYVFRYAMRHAKSRFFKSETSFWLNSFLAQDHAMQIEGCFTEEEN
jgi:hypothetical protein